MLDGILKSVEEFNSGNSALGISRLNSLVSNYPDCIEPRVVLAQHLSEQAEYVQASELMQECIALSNDWDVLKFACKVFYDARDFELCKTVSLKLLEMDASDMECYSKLGHSYLMLKQHSKAVSVFQHLEQIYKLTPEDMVDYALALFHCRHGMDVAIRHILKAIQIDPNNIQVGIRLALALTYCGESKAAAKCFKHFALKEVERSLPQFCNLFSNYLLQLNYDEEMSLQEIFIEHCKYGELIREEMACPKPDDCRSISFYKIGFLSGDLCSHPVSFFLLPLLKEICRKDFRIYIYSATPNERLDHTTKQIQELADNWQDVSHVPFETLHLQLREDELDCIIDLSGHTGVNRLFSLAKRVAPIQATWLGYPNTTGLQNIDYRIVDEVTDPIGSGDSFYTETLCRMEAPFICYLGSNKDNGNIFLPVQNGDSVVFSSNNNWLKLSGSTLSAWGKILNSVPCSVLRLKYNYGEDVDINYHLKSKFKDHGIMPDQVKFLGSVPDFEEHLKSFNSVDISLDPFPYNGTTSTCDSLYMGVPVIALRGGRHSARVSASILTAIGCGEFIAESVDEYIDIAIKLAGDRDNLLNTKKRVREAMLNSPLMDAPDFAKRFSKCLLGILDPG